MSAASTATLERGALVALDRALELARTRPALEIARALGPGLVLSALSLALYYAERVEGVRSLRAVFAIAFSVAFVVRGAVLARWAGARVDEMLAPYGVEEPSAGASTAARAALWVGLDLWAWLWLLVLAVHLDPWFVPLVLPALSVRGALAPSWLACASKSSGASGFGTIRRAVEHAEGQRMLGITTELLMLLGALGLAFNLGAVAALVVSIAQDLVGLDLAFVRAFLSPRNHFALLVLACVSLTLLEPVRAALSAVLFTDSLLVRDGVAVRSLVERSTQHPRRRGALGRAAVVLALALAGVSHARAQPQSEQAEAPVIELDEPIVVEPAGSESSTGGDIVEANDEAAALEVPEPPEPPCDETCTAARAHDAHIEARVRKILEEPTFTEFPDEAWDVDQVGKGALESWVERFLKWLFERKEEPENLPDGAISFGNVPGSTFFLIVAAGLLLAVALRLLLGPRAPKRETAEVEPAREDPFARPAEAHLDEALALATQDLALALRSLYLATLVGLERRNLLRLSPERTNGQYLRQLPVGDERAQFGTLTRVFDAVHYGARTPTREDFETCRAIAERLMRRVEMP